MTDERVGDNSEFELFQALKAGKPSKLLADSTYDSRDNFNLLAKLCIEPGWVDLKRRRPRVKK